MRPTVPGERAHDCEAHIHQRHWWEIGRLCVEGDRTYLGRSAACHGIVTEDEEIHPDRAAEVSSGRDRKSTRLNSSHRCLSYAVFCLPKNGETIVTSSITRTGPRSRVRARLGAAS